MHLLQVVSNEIVVQLCSSWQNSNWHSASRGPSAIAELLIKAFSGYLLLFQLQPCWSLALNVYYSVLQINLLLVDNVRNVFSAQCTPRNYLLQFWVWYWHIYPKSGFHKYYGDNCRTIEDWAAVMTGQLDTLCLLVLIRGRRAVQLPLALPLPLFRPFPAAISRWLASWKSVLLYLQFEFNRSSPNNPIWTVVPKWLRRLILF